MEHQFLVGIRLREQEDVDDHRLAITRPALLQHVVLSGARSIHQLQFHIPLQRLNPDRRPEIRQAQRLLQCRAVVLIFWEQGAGGTVLLLISMGILAVSVWLARREPFTRIKI